MVVTCEFRNETQRYELKEYGFNCQQ